MPERTPHTRTPNDTVSVSTAKQTPPGEPAPRGPLVSVIIPCYNHARFLGEAVESALEQTYRPVETVVVDDGSTDDTAEVAANYPNVKYIRQKNKGLAAARNTGIRESKGEYLVFLDADDRLVPAAVDAGIKAFQNDPQCGFIFGTFRWIDADGSVLARPDPPRINDDPYAEMLRRNFISMHASVIYRRDVLDEVEGFDTSLAACEDYDIYLRISRRFPVRGHSEVIAEYRQHGSNMSGDSELILTSALQALNTQRNHAHSSRHLRQAYEDGVRFWTSTYGQQVFWPTAHLRMQGKPKQTARAAATLLRYVPRWFIKQTGMQFLKDAFHFVKPALPASLSRRLQARWPALDHRFPPPVGNVRFGNLRRTTPIDRHFGYSRGLPVDRYYIEQFLADNARDIRGCTLEVKDNTYTRRFGGDQVRHSDVLDVDRGNPNATVIGDLADGDALPSATYDCFILTQTLQLIYDLRAALRTSHRLLKPGGVMLVTVPGITKIDQGSSWYWFFTAASAERLFQEIFPSANVTVEAYGNVLTAQAFLQGLSAEELQPEELEHQDPDYPVSVVIRAEKTADRQCA